MGTKATTNMCARLARCGRCRWAYLLPSPSFPVLPRWEGDNHYGHYREDPKSPVRHTPRPLSLSLSLSLSHSTLSRTLHAGYSIVLSSRIRYCSAALALQYSLFLSAASSPSVMSNVLSDSLVSQSLYQPQGAAVREVAGTPTRASRTASSAPLQPEQTSGARRLRVGEKIVVAAW